MTEFASGKYWSQSCVVIGCPRGQEGPILPARDFPHWSRKETFLWSCNSLFHCHAIKIKKCKPLHTESPESGKWEKKCIQGSPPPPVPVSGVELRVYPRQLVNVSAPFLCRLSRLYQDEWPLACFLCIWYVPALHCFTWYVYLFVLLYRRTPLQ